MFLDEYREYCLSLPAVTESLYDNNFLAFKVLDKVFSLTNVENFSYVNLKCDPDYAIELREEHNFIKHGYYMNKKHWNSIWEPQMVDESLLISLVNHSYEKVVSKMTKKKQMELKEIE